MMSVIEDMDSASRTILSCPQCGHENLPQWNYCAKCGAALWEYCLGCGEACAAAENYCGSCGARLSDAAASHFRQIEEYFHSAADMASANRYDEAIALLTPIGRNPHPRLTEHVGRAQELLRKLVAERQRHRTAAEEACQLARHCIAAHDFDGAASYINRVLPPFQTNQWKELRDQIAERQREIETITEELRCAVSERRLLDLPPRLERLLALKPDDAYAKNLRDLVRKQLIVAARKMMAEHRYDRVAQLLEHVDSQADATEVQQLRRDAAELAWLATDLRSAPVIDGALVAVAQRFRRLAPGDAQNVRLCEKLDRRIHSAGTGWPDGPPPWARPPGETPVGVPVEWFSGFKRMARADGLDGAELGRRPGCFATACGLALAGLRQGAVRINLFPTGSMGVLRRITQSVRRRGARASWGIDVGGSSLKAVRLAWNEANGQAVIEAVSFVEHSKPLGCAADEAERRRLVAETLEAFLGRHETKGERVCVGVPGRTALCRQIAVPPADSAKLAKLVSFEAANHFPVPMEQLAWDFHAFDGSVRTPPNDMQSLDTRGRDVLLVAVKRATTESLLAVFKEHDVPVDVLQPDFVGLHNFLIHDHFALVDGPPSDRPMSAVAAMDVGSDETNLLVSSPDSLWFRTCGVGGRSFTRALVKQFNLSVAEAENRKQSPEPAERLGEFHEVLAPVMDDLLRELQRSLEAYATAQPNRPVARLLGLGGGFCLHGLFRYLRCGR